MAKLYQRKTIVIDLAECGFVVLPAYLPDFTFVWPVLTGSSDFDTAYTFTGRETWIPF